MGIAPHMVNVSPLAAIVAAGSGLDHAVWYGTRALGLIAYGLATASVLLGIAVSTRAGERVSGRGSTADVHRVLSLLTLLVVAGHVLLLLLLDQFTRFGPADVLVPFASSYRPVWTAVGIVAAYLIFAVFVSFYLRRWLGYRAWRTLHYATFAVFALATLHGILAGTDSGAVWARLMYAAAVAAVAAAGVYRLLRGVGPEPRWAWQAGDVGGPARALAASAVITAGMALALVLPFTLAPGHGSQRTADAGASGQFASGASGHREEGGGRDDEDDGEEEGDGALFIRFAGQQAADGSWRLAAGGGSPVLLDAEVDGGLELIDAMSGQVLYHSQDAVRISEAKGELQALMLGAGGRRISLSGTYRQSGGRMLLDAELTAS